MFPVNGTQSQESIWDFQVYSRFSKGTDFFITAHTCAVIDTSAVNNAIFPNAVNYVRCHIS